MADTNTQTSDNNSLLTFAPKIFAFSDIIAAVFFSLDPLESPRPDAASSHNQQFASDTEVYSRPWEDPFDLPEEKPTGAVNYGSGSSTTTNSSETSDGDLVCLVSLSEAPWSDWVEIRRRARYAIVSALLNAQYISTNPGVVQVHYFSSDISNTPRRFRAG